MATSAGRVPSRSRQVARLQSYHLPSSFLLPQPFVPTFASAAALHAELRQRFMRHSNNERSSRIRDLFPTPTGDKAPRFLRGHVPDHTRVARKNWRSPSQLEAPAPHPAVISFRPAPTFRCTTRPGPDMADWRDTMRRPLRIACQHPGARGTQEPFTNRTRFQIRPMLVDQGIRSLPSGFPMFTHTAYLGPGQLVFWPVVDLESACHMHISSLKNYIQILIATTIAALKLLHPEGMEGSKRYHAGMDPASVGLPWDGILLGSVWSKRHGQSVPRPLLPSVLPRALLPPGNPRSQVLGRVATLWDMRPEPLSLILKRDKGTARDEYLHLPNIAVAIDLTTSIMRPEPWARLRYCHDNKLLPTLPTIDMASWNRDSGMEWDDELMTQLLRAAWTEQFIARLHRHYEDDNVYKNEGLVRSQPVADREMEVREFVRLRPSYEAKQIAEIRRNKWVREAARLGKYPEGDPSLRTWAGWVDKRDPAEVMGPEWVVDNVYLAEAHARLAELEPEESQDDLDDQAKEDAEATAAAAAPAPATSAAPREPPPEKHPLGSPSKFARLDGQISVLPDEDGKVVVSDEQTMALHYEMVELHKKKGKAVGPVHVLPDPGTDDLDPWWAAKEARTNRILIRNGMRLGPDIGPRAAPADQRSASGRGATGTVPVGWRPLQYDKDVVYWKGQVDQGKREPQSKYSDTGVGRLRLRQA